ncbi:MAG: hypothetical protein WDN04_17315 [Rhodospirillales bacterium]
MSVTIGWGMHNLGGKSRQGVWGLRAGWSRGHQHQKVFWFFFSKKNKKKRFFLKKEAKTLGLSQIAKDLGW